ncbi:MAG: DUF1365 domain-containing protein [Alphaproteobacteria bacterium]|nr:DUF1365 domain-containing protein [Alphaproteobacteria bacterium]
MSRSTQLSDDLDARCEPAAVLYRGWVMHARMKPFVHRFTYRVFSLFIDIDMLDKANTQSAIFSVGHFNLLSFYPSDHGDRDGSSLRAHAERLLKQAGLTDMPARIKLLCYPRLLGFGFNPLSIYYCLDDEDHIAALIYEVRNTFGDIHSYVIPVRAQHVSAADEIRQECDKAFYVSPFLDMTMRYRFRLQPPGSHLRLRILELDTGGPILSATFSGERLPLNLWTSFLCFVAIPLLSVKVVLAIHWEALRLWFKGAKYYAHHAPRTRASIPSDP